MHRLECRTSSTYLFRITHEEEERLADSQFLNGELIKSTLVVISRFNEELLPYRFMVLEERYTIDLEAITKVTNILKELASTINMNE